MYKYGQRSSKSKKRLVMFVVVLVVVLVAAGVFWKRPQAPLQVSEQVRVAAPGAVIGPQKLPKGIVVSAQPVFDREEKIVVTEFENSTGNDIVLSQQVRPEGIDLKQIDAAETFLADIGPVYVLKGEAGQLQIIIDAGDSWVFINASANIGMEPIRALIGEMARL